MITDGTQAMPDSNEIRAISFTGLQALLVVTEASNALKRAILAVMESPAEMDAQLKAIDATLASLEDALPHLRAFRNLIHDDRPNWIKMQERFHPRPYSDLKIDERNPKEVIARLVRSMEKPQAAS